MEQAREFRLACVKCAFGDASGVCDKARHPYYIKGRFWGQGREITLGLRRGGQHLEGKEQDRGCEVRSHRDREEWEA